MTRVVMWLTEYLGEAAMTLDSLALLPKDDKEDERDRHMKTATTNKGT